MLDKVFILWYIIFKGKLDGSNYYGSGGVFMKYNYKLWGGC